MRFSTRSPIPSDTHCLPNRSVRVTKKKKKHTHTRHWSPFWQFTQKAQELKHTYFPHMRRGCRWWRQTASNPKTRSGCPSVRRGSSSALFHLPDQGSVKLKLQKKQQTNRKNPSSDQKDNPEWGGGGREMNASVALRGYVRMRGMPIYSDLPENMNTCVKSLWSLTQKHYNDLLFLPITRFFDVGWYGTQASDFTG